MSTPHLLLIVPGYAFVTTAAAIVRAAGKCGVTVSVITRLAPEFYESHPHVLDVVASNADNSPQEVAALRERVHALYRARPFAKVVTFSEDHVEIAAELNERYGLGGNPPRTARLSRDKYLMRGALQARGVAVPRFFPVESYEEFEAAVREVGFPCISKPVKACASEGVVKIEDGAALREAYEFSYRVRQLLDGGPRVLVEEYVSGREYSVEVVVSGGVPHVAGITEKTTEAEPFFGEIMHVFPADLDAETERRVHETVAGTVAALEVVEGGVHLEFRLAPRGPVVMECATRLGGDSLPIAIAAGTGVDLYECVIRQAVGIPFSLERSRPRWGGIRFMQTEEEGTLSAIGFDRPRIARMRGVVSYGTLRKEGDFVARPPRSDTHRLGFVLAVGDSAAAVREVLTTAETTFEFALA